MTIREAAQQGITALTRPEWDEHGRIIIDIVTGPKGNVYYGPWGTVHDAATDGGVLEPQKVCLLLAFSGDDDQWEKWEE